MRTAAICFGLMLALPGKTDPAERMAEAEAMRWSQRAQVALVPAGKEVSDTWLFFHLSNADLETLLEQALSLRDTEPLILTGGRAKWNPLRPWPDRIFALDLWHKSGVWQPAGSDDDSLFSVVLPESLFNRLLKAMSPWLRPPAPRDRSGNILLQPGRIAFAAELVDEWKASVGAAEQPPQRARLESFGFHRVLNAAPKTWFGRSSTQGWLFAAIALMMLTSVGLLISRRRKTGPA